MKVTNLQIAKSAVRDLLIDMGENPEREGLLDTPNRVVKSYNELTKGYNMRIGKVLKTKFTSEYSQMVLLKDIEFYSLCEHHLLPFFGKVHVAYIPDGEIVGISKLARLVEMYARRLQVQEQMTEQIANALEKNIKVKGVAVMVEGQHFCMMMRGVCKQDSKMVTTKLLGAFMDEPETRAEFYNMIK